MFLIVDADQSLLSKNIFLERQMKDMLNERLQRISEVMAFHSLINYFLSRTLVYPSSETQKSEAFMNRTC